MSEWQDDVQEGLEEILFPRMVEQRDEQVFVTFDKSNDKEAAEAIVEAVDVREWAPDDVAAMPIIVDEDGDTVQWGVRIDDADTIEAHESAAETARQKINEALRDDDVIDLEGVKED